MKQELLDLFKQAQEHRKNGMTILQAEKAVGKGKGKGWFGNTKARIEGKKWTKAKTAAPAKPRHRNRPALSKVVVTDLPQVTMPGASRMFVFTGTPNELLTIARNFA